MLDDMEIADLREAVAMTDVPALLEASSGMTLESLAAIGVDLISVSALTRSVPTLDVSLDLEPSETRQNEPAHGPDCQ